MRWVGDRIEALGYRVRQLAADRARSVLVMLGVVWGALSLTVVFSFGEGLYQGIEGTMAASGKDYLRFWAGSTTRPHGGMAPGRWVGLQADDATLIAEGIPEVRAVSVEFIASNQNIARGTTRINAAIHGVDASFGELRSVVAQPGGRFLNWRDERERRAVVFLGNAVKEGLFGNAAAVGETIELWGRPFTIVGVMRPKVAMSNYEWRDEQKLFVPATTFATITGWRHVNYLIVGLARREADQAVVGQVYRLLGARHGFDPQDRAAVGLLNQVALERVTRGIVLGVRVLMAIVGVLGLLVALVGVTNVLFVMVEEQRAEIGVFMALGATPRTVLFGPLVDGALLTLAGGAGGILSSVGVLAAFNALPLGAEPRAFLGRPELSVGIAALVVATLCLAAVAAAWVPARRAATSDPIESLREE